MTSRAGRWAMCAALAVGATGVCAADVADEAFIEFLGSFDDGEGNWLDPTELLQPEADNGAARQRTPRRTHEDEDKTENDDDDATDND